MSITFVSKAPVPQLEQNIMLGDECIGWIKTTDHSNDATRWHAGITICWSECTFDNYLAQGFGDTQQAAIDNALEKAATFADKVAAESRSMMFAVHSQYEKERNGENQ